MKVVFIEPNIEGYTLMPTMSLAVLKSFINNKTRHRAKIIDLTFHKKDWRRYLTKEIDREKPDLIGISTLSFNYHQSLEVASFIKKNHNIKIVFGGVHPILMPEEVIENNQVDVVCIGEGEYMLKEILDNNLDYWQIKGIWYKDNGKVIKNEDRNLIENLDELPYPDWNDFELEKYFLINNYHLPIMASRGCPYSCTYCSNHALRKRLKGKYVRFRNIENVLEEIGIRIEQYYNKGLRYLFFYDDTFVLHKNYVLEFCRQYRKRGYNRLLKWNVNARADLITEEIIKSMKGAGCFEVRMGVEAANDYIRNDIYKRKMSKKQIFDAIEIIKNYGLQLRLQFIIGAPYETLDMMIESFKMAKDANVDYILFPILMPLPCTEIRKICKEEGLIEKRKFKNSHSMYTRPVIRTKYTTRGQVKKFVSKIRNYQIKKYLLEGLRMKGVVFLWDLFVFLIYYKPKYDLEIDNAWRFTINKYKLKKLDR